MYAALNRLIVDIESCGRTSDILAWASPVPFFGRISDSRIATVGINPSSREFVDANGFELVGHRLRLETLSSLSLEVWSLASGRDVRQITRTCERYFESNPYRTWFDVLDRMLSTAGVSYYENPAYLRACHIDLVPFATREKWGSLPESVRRSLCLRGRPAMAELIRDSALKVLILNGESVVREFERFAAFGLSRSLVNDWTLPRHNGNGVPGFLYHGSVSSIDGVDLDREVTVIGYNHNLQSSFGVTSNLIHSIGERVSEDVESAARA